MLGWHLQFTKTMKEYTGGIQAQLHFLGKRFLQPSFRINSKIKLHFHLLKSIHGQAIFFVILGSKSFSFIFGYVNFRLEG